MARILVVDDEEGIRSFIAGALELDEHEVTQAENGVEAARLITQTSFDLLLTDLKMPQMDGMVIQPEHLWLDPIGAATVEPGVRDERQETLDETERAAIERALRSCGGNRREAAEMLGMAVRTLYNKLRRYREVD